MTASTKLGDLVSILGGGTPSRNRADYYNGDIPWVTVKDLKDELTLSSAQERITKLGLENSASRLVPAGTVIVATRMAVGKAVRTLTDVAINQDLKAVVCGQRIDSRFLLFFLHSKASLLEAKASGSTVKGILIEDLQEMEVALPSVPEQQRIAMQLEQADGLVRNRRYALELTDTFLPAAFLELFGDPAKNQRDFDVIELDEDLERIESGFSPICEGARERLTEWAVLGLGAVTGGVFRPQENKKLPTEILPRPDLEVKDGDLLVTRKNTYDLVAACAYVRKPPPRLLLPDTIFRFRLKQDSRLSPVFLWGLLSCHSFRKTVQNLASGSAGSMPGISKEKFMAIRCPVPPLELQQKFTALVGQVERLRAVQSEALRQAEHLFQSLLYKAFSAETESSYAESKAHHIGA